MPFAVIAAKLSQSAINTDEGIIEGCKLCEVGKVAVFQGLDGKPVQIRMRPEVVDKLLALWSAAGEGAAHWTHRWVETGEDGLETKVATWKNFRKDDGGNLLADAHLWDTPKRQIILSAAAKDPKGLMVSQVFDYTGGLEDCNPVSVHAADFVERGASTTSLLAKLSANQKPARMAISIEDLKDLCADPAAKEVLRGAIEGHDKAAEMADDEMAEMEADAGVTEEDKKDEKEPEKKEQEPALMKLFRIIRRCNRAINRRVKSVALNEEAILAKAKVQAKAEFAGNLGNNKAILAGLIPGAPQSDQPVHRFIGRLQTELQKKGMRESEAIARARKDAIAAGQEIEFTAWDAARRPMTLNQ